MFGPQLSEILEYVKQLDSVDTANVEPTYNVTGLNNVWREDIVKESLSQAAALANAKRKDRGYFVVDRVAAGV